MRLQIRNVPALDLCDAAAEGSVDRVESLLASGVDPNARFDDLDSVLSGVAEDWASDEKSAQAPIFFPDHTEWPALRRATEDTGVRYAVPDEPKTMRLMTALLQHGADPYAVFRQPIRIYQDEPVFPGQARDTEWDDEDADLRRARLSRTGIMEKALRLESQRRHREQATSEREANDPFYDFEYDAEGFIDYQDRFPRKYGVCSIIHSLLEDGMFVKPVLDFLGNKLDIERRDPQGRTLFLAACRSTLGLDAAVGGIYTSLFRDSDAFRTCNNPFPQPENPWKQYKPTSLCAGPTLLEFFITRGANLLAVDNYGQNAFHHLFGCSDREAQCIPPLIDTAVKYLVKNCPSLINQPDKAGLYPLHLALRRMGSVGRPDPEIPEALFRFETAVDDLLAANADPLVRDSRGNTVLHYLAACRLGEGDQMGDEQRRLLRVFLDRGVDPKARNTTGISALEIFFTTGGDELFRDADDYDHFYAIGEEVLGLFEHGGDNYEETNANEQTLLHMVASLVSDRAYPWFKILQAKGLDPMAKDKEGQTPFGIAQANEDLRQALS